MRVRYSIWDPSGNITALVESPVPVERQSAVAAELMARHPAVEQLGFVSWQAEDGTDAVLRMAGGEFCGNASMSAAALLQSRLESAAPSGAWITRSLRVSGAKQPVAVRLCREEEGVYRGAVCMPKARAMPKLTIASSICPEACSASGTERLMYLAMHTVMTMNPQPCITWLSMATYTLPLSPSISQRTASVTADRRISGPAP